MRRDPWYVPYFREPVLHALDTVEIEGAPPGIFPASATQAGEPGQPTTGRTISIADLLRGATDQAGPGRYRGR
jgi:hypothetical protein